MKQPETKAIEMFNEALDILSDFPFIDLKSRKEKAKKLCFYQISNVKISFYEAEKLDIMPDRSHEKTLAYYSKIYLIISKF